MGSCWIASLALAATLTAAHPGPAASDPGSGAPGSEARAVIPVVGAWEVVQAEGRRLLKVDGTRWRPGQAGTGLPEKARELYGGDDAGFLASVRANPSYPFAVAREPASFQDGEITLRFKPLAGREDRAAGILFDLKSNGDYLALRTNALENNLVLWRVVQGRHSALAEVRNTPIASGHWHELKLTVRGRLLRGYLDGEEVLLHTLDQPVAGRAGIWSRADSVVLFDQFEVH